MGSEDAATALQALFEGGFLVPETSLLSEEELELLRRCEETKFSLNTTTQPRLASTQTSNSETNLSSIKEGENGENGDWLTKSKLGMGSEFGEEVESLHEGERMELGKVLVETGLNQSLWRMVGNECDEESLRRVKELDESTAEATHLWLQAVQNAPRIVQPNLERSEGLECEFHMSFKAPPPPALLQRDQARPPRTERLQSRISIPEDVPLLGWTSRDIVKAIMQQASRMRRKPRQKRVVSKVHHRTTIASTPATNKNRIVDSSISSSTTTLMSNENKSGAFSTSSTGHAGPTLSSSSSSSSDSSSDNENDDREELARFMQLIGPTSITETLDNNKSVTAADFKKQQKLKPRAPPRVPPNKKLRKTTTIQRTSNKEHQEKATLTHSLPTSSISQLSAKSSVTKRKVSTEKVSSTISTIGKSKDRSASGQKSKRKSPKSHLEGLFSAGEVLDVDAFLADIRAETEVKRKGKRGDTKARAAKSQVQTRKDSRSRQVTTATLPAAEDEAIEKDSVVPERVEKRLRQHRQEKRPDAQREEEKQKASTQTVTAQGDREIAVEAHRGSTHTLAKPPPVISSTELQDNRSCSTNYIAKKTQTHSKDNEDIAKRSEFRSSATDPAHQAKKKKRKKSKNRKDKPAGNDEVGELDVDAFLAEIQRDVE